MIDGFESKLGNGDGIEINYFKDYSSDAKIISPKSFRIRKALGQYVKLDCKENDRAVFKHFEEELFLYYHANQCWIVRFNFAITDRILNQN